MSNKINIRFRSRCPAPSCQNTKTIDWVHANCGSELTLDNEGIVRCDRGDLADYVFRLQFDCGYRLDGAHKAGYECGNLQGFLNALSIMGNLKQAPTSFIFDVTRVLINHQNDFIYS